MDEQLNMILKEILSQKYSRLSRLSLVSSLSSLSRLVSSLSLVSLSRLSLSLSHFDNFLFGESISSVNIPTFRYASGSTSRRKNDRPLSTMFPGILYTYTEFFLMLMD